MKKSLYLLFASIIYLTGCSEKTEFTLKGQLEGLASDTLLAYFQVPESKIDTIICEKGSFEYTFTPDTLTVFSLLLDEKELLPIYADKGETVEINGSTSDLSIKGRDENQLMNQILKTLKQTPEADIIKTVDSLIQTNNNSFTNIYLLDKYYTKNASTDFDHIEELIEKQSGVIKDTPYFIDLQAKINAYTSKNRTQYVHSLSGFDREGKVIKWPTTRNDYILLDFWASWSSESVAEQDSLVNVLKALKKEDFLIFSVSLDLDKEAWLKASDRDTTQWRQVCDFKGWNNNIIKSQGIYALPSNLLLDKSKRIVAKNIRGKELIDKVKELIKKDKEREQERAARKRRR